MAVETYVNLAETTLASGYTAGSGTLSVTSAADFPATGNFRIRLGNGSRTLLQVTGVAGTTFTVTAEADDANGAGGDTVTAVLTAGGLDAILSPYPSSVLTGRASELYLGKLAEYEPLLTVPASPDAMDDEFTAGSLDGKWTEVVSSGATFTKAFNTPGTGWLQVTTANSSKSWTISQAIPAGDWEMQARVGITIAASSYHGVGLCLMEAQTTAGKLYWAKIDGNNGAASLRAGAEYYTNIDTFSAGRGAAYTGANQTATLTVLRLVKASTNYAFYASRDGVAWRLLYSGTVAEFTPGFVGVMVNSVSESTTSWAWHVDWFRRIA
jgi:hypothetical protein